MLEMKMRKFIDLTGQKFGRLTIIKRNYPNDKFGKINWLCKCECGKEKVVVGNNLKNGNSKSCGCLRKELNEFRPGLSNMRNVINGYKQSARK